jgi:hypothetical protein
MLPMATAPSRGVRGALLRLPLLNDGLVVHARIAFPTAVQAASGQHYRPTPEASQAQHSAVDRCAEKTTNNKQTTAARGDIIRNARHGVI